MPLSDKKIKILNALYFYNEGLFTTPKKTIRGWANLTSLNGNTVKLLKTFIKKEILKPDEKQYIKGILCQLYSVDKDKILDELEEEKKLMDILQDGFMILRK